MPRPPASPPEGPEAERDACERALRAAPDDLELLLDAADLYVTRLQDEEPDPALLEHGLALAARGAKLARRGGEPEWEAEFALQEARALSQLGRPAEALARAAAGLAVLPDDVDLALERGLAAYELCRFEEARADLSRVVRAAPDDALAHQTLGLALERLGDPAGAARHLARATRLAPEDFPAPVSLSPDRFEAQVEEALAALPEPVRRYLANVAIQVEDLPSVEELAGEDPPLSPSILGLFRGAPLGQKASADPWSHFPSSIVLFQRNLERFARDERELREEIGITLLHEVGHFLGLDEDQLRDRGLD